MNKLVYKLTTAVSTAALLTGSVASVAFGTTSVTVSGNGSDSTNTANVSVSTSTTLVQTNNADIDNSVKINPNSGNNEAEDNTGGDVSIDTGDANGSSSVSNSANSNVASLSCGGCPGDLDVKISGNGSDSENEANVELISEVGVEQANEAEDNTGGDVAIDTGDADVEVGVSNEANFNGLNLDECCELVGEIKIAGNGADSENEVNVELEALLAAKQTNDYDCDGGPRGFLSSFGGGHGRGSDCNDVDVDSNTGDNDAKDNTQGGEDPTIETGDAGADVEVSTEANSNVLGDVDFPDPPDLPALDAW